MTDVIGAVFARGGSKGLPGKNLREIAGESLVERAVRIGLTVKDLRAVYCSTDSHEIAEVARRAGATVPFIRPSTLATDSSPELDAWRHLLTYLELEEGQRPDVLVSLPPTSPLRSAHDVEAAVSLFLEGQSDLVVALTPSQRNPWFNMVTANESGELSLVCDPGDSTFFRRQDVPKAWDITTVVYVAAVDYVLSTKNLMHGLVRGIEVKPETAIDIDTDLDLRIAKLLAGEHQSGGV